MNTFSMTLKVKGSKEAATTAEFSEEERSEIVEACDADECATSDILRDLIVAEHAVMQEVYVCFEKYIEVTTQAELRTAIIEMVNNGDFDTEELN